MSTDAELDFLDLICCVVSTGYLYAKRFDLKFKWSLQVVWLEAISLLTSLAGRRTKSAQVSCFRKIIYFVLVVQLHLYLVLSRKSDT